MSNDLVVRNLGPVTELSMPIPESGGVVVLRGCQGSGKSTVLSGAAALGGKTVPRLPVRDGAKRAEIEFNGARLVVTRATTRKSGELLVESIDGRFDLSKVIDPGIADDDRADAARIKQLLALTGAQGNLEAYRALVPAELWDELDVEFIEDPIELHRRFVAECHRVARREEKAATEARVDVPALKERFAGLNLTDPPSIEDAQQAQEAAAIELATIKEKIKAAAYRRAEIDAAKRSLVELREQYDGLTVQEAEANREVCLQGARAAYQAMLDATATYEAASQLHKDAEASHKAAVQHQKAVDVAERILNADREVCPTVDELEAAERAAAEARDAAQQTVFAWEARRSLELAEQGNAQARFKNRVAAQLREIATKSEEVLAETLPGMDMRVYEGRLVVATDRSQSEFFSELSHGERSILAIKAAARFVPKRGLVTIGQEVWGGVSPANKLAIHHLAQELGIVLLTAEAHDEPLSAEVMS